MTVLARNIVAVLGGDKAVKESISSPMDLVQIVRKGAPFGWLGSVAEKLGLSLEATAPIVGIAPRTLARRKLTGQLDPQESERVLRVAKAIARATSVLGTADKARAWLGKNNRALRDVAPLSMMDTDLGAQAVDDVLGRIEHGIVG
jgi:putative toxin-antitoxin system antitoxin component (TIGR02293 family)